MSSEKTFISAVIELGRNSVLAAALAVFSVSAELTPSLLNTVTSWSRTGILSFVLAMLWSVLIVTHFGRTAHAVFREKKHGDLLLTLSVALGAVFVYGVMTVPPLGPITMSLWRIAPANLTPRTQKIAKKRSRSRRGNLPALGA